MLAGASRFIGLGLMLVIAAGCGPAPSGAGESVGEDEQALKPACAPPTTVLGIDIASYQHPNGAGIDWNAVAQNRRFVIIKASEGTGYTNSYYADDSAQARAHGMIAGAYHFLRYTSSGAAQAQHFLTSIGGNVPKGDLPAMLDVEEVNDAASPGQRVQIMKEWLDTVEAATGRKPMIYSGSWYWGPYLGSPGGYGGVYPMVWAAYNNCPQIPDDFPGITIWQYLGGDGTTPGIPAACDQDMFYGSEAELMQLANATPDYRAEFVGQSFPPAAQPFQMIPGQKLSAYIELKNTGNKPWDGSTRIGTTGPRDRSSPFVAGDWLGPNRPSAASGVVNPGDSYKFKITFQAPADVGSYDEHFGVVQEAVTWFSDPGQGGPADNFLEARIDVVKPKFAAKFVSQSFPLSSQAPLEIEQGSSVDGYIELENVGTETWKPGETKLAPTPRDKASPLGHDGWLSAGRVSTVDHPVKPGEKYKFPLELSGVTLGKFDQTFGMVEELVTWFADPPNGGGPSDDFLRVVADVVVKRTGTKPQGTGGSGGSSSSTGGAKGSPEKTKLLDDSNSDGCACSAPGSTGSHSYGGALLVLALCAYSSRRRRRLIPH